LTSYWTNWPSAWWLEPMSELVLASEYLPATNGARHDLVLLHGWGSNREIWRPLLATLRPWANITLIDLPSCSRDLSHTPVPANVSLAIDEPRALDGLAGLETLLQGILARAPGRACFVGWSLGGALAAELAHRYPYRVSALVTLCCNPCFVANGEWPGMDRAYFSAFCEKVASNPGKALRRFDSLQLAGSGRSRMLQRQLAQQRLLNNPSSLSGELALLGEIDTRRLLPVLKLPQLHLLAEADGLVPREVKSALSQTLAVTPDAAVASLGPVSHVAPLEIPEQLAAEIVDFLAAAGLLQASRALPSKLEKKEVGHSFSVAARAYDSVAGLQREVGDRLLQSISIPAGEDAVVLDLGCGTGHFYPQLSRLAENISYIGVDLACGMVEYARSRFAGAGQWIVGDAEHLPVAASSVDLVFSSLAIQWCRDPQLVFAELARVLRPGGQCVFTSLGPDTLKELKESWASVDDYQHVNSFMPASFLHDAARNTPGISLHLRGENFFMHYDRVGELLRELKVLGAHNMNKGRSAGLTSAKTMQGMFNAYESWRDGGKLPATYDVQFGVISKQGL